MVHMFIHQHMLISPTESCHSTQVMHVQLMHVSTSAHSHLLSHMYAGHDLHFACSRDSHQTWRGNLAIVFDWYVHTMLCVHAYVYSYVYAYVHVHVHTHVRFFRGADRKHLSSLSAVLSHLFQILYCCCRAPSDTQDAMGRVDTSLANPFPNFTFDRNVSFWRISPGTFRADIYYSHRSDIFVSLKILDGSRYSV
jgi:hypothetical protein